MYDLFDLLLLKQDIKKKKQVIKLESKLELNNNKKYKVKTIYDSKIYVNKISNKLPNL